MYDIIRYMNNHTTDEQKIAEQLRCFREKKETLKPKRAAVLLPLVYRNGEPNILFEVRAKDLVIQPGEVCFPGGGVEGDETPLEAAVRETMEELLVRKEQIRIIGLMDVFTGPRGQEVSAFVGALDDYEGGFSTDEVDSVIITPLKWFMEHPAVYYRTVRTVVPGEDFPFGLVPGGRNYHWGKEKHLVPFYPGTDPVLWGMTARLTDLFMKILKGEL